MSHRKRAGLCVLFATLAASCAWAEGAGLDSLKKWVGHIALPPDQDKDVWSDPVFRDAVAKALDKEHFDALFNGYAKQVVAPVEQAGDVLMAFACKAQECHAYGVRVYIDLKKQAAFACWRSPGDDTWFAAGKPPRSVGSGGCSRAPDFKLYDLYGKE